MTAPRDRKLYLGPRLRTLRRELGLTQTRMAEELGVSPSYLNHLERNQRPLTAQMLLRLADTYNLDMRGFVAGAHQAAASDLGEILADDLVRDLGIGRQEVLEVAENYPGVAEAVKRLYRALADLRQMPGRVAAAAGSEVAASPIARLRDWVEGHDNRFPALDTAAETLSAALGEGPEALRSAMVARLEAAHGASVRVVPAEVLPDAWRHYDFHRRRLLLSERLSASGRLFAIAALVAELDLNDAIAATLADDAPADAETRGLARQMLVSWAAAATLMPAARFHAAAEAMGDDVDRLADRFGTSYEQVAHRLTTRASPATFLLKLDMAGNIVKRFTGGRSPLARYGGGCPRWRVHRAWTSPGETLVDPVELPDGTRYLTWARASASRGRAPHLLVLGRVAEEAVSTVYAAAAPTTPTPIGMACHLCERAACPDRSLPPITRVLDAHPHTRPVAPYPFRPI